jgi:hypothetical protein
MQLATSKLGGMKFDAPHLLASGLLARPVASPDSLHRVAVEPAIMAQKAAAPSGQDEAVELIEQLLIAGDVSARTNSVIREQLAQAQAPSDTTQVLDTMSALILGSPEFQMR